MKGYRLLQRAQLLGRIQSNRFSNLKAQVDKLNFLLDANSDYLENSADLTCRQVSVVIAAIVRLIDNAWPGN